MGDEPAIGEPAWRLQLYGRPLAAHDPRCWLDPRHHAKTPCSWPVAKEYEVGRAVGYAEGYLEARAEPSADGYMRIDTLRICTCGVITGGIRVPRPSCPFHAGSADG